MGLFVGLVARGDTRLEVPFRHQQIPRFLHDSLNGRGRDSFTKRQPKITRKRAIEKILRLESECAEEENWPNAKCQSRGAVCISSRVRVDVAVMACVIKCLNRGADILRCKDIADPDRQYLQVRLRFGSG